MNFCLLFVVVFCCFGGVKGVATTNASFKIIVDLSPSGSDPKKSAAMVIREATEFLQRTKKENVAEIVNASWARGWAYLMMRRPEKAIEDFETMCKLRPDDATFYALRALAMADLGKMREAEALAYQAVKKDPLVLAAHVVRGSIDAAQGKWATAGNSASFALEFDKNLPSAVYLEACVAFGVGDYPRCLSCVNQYAAFSLAPGIREPEEPFILRGNACVALARYRDALGNFKTARNLNPWSVSAADGISASYSEMRQWQLAAKAADEAAALAPKDAWVHMNRALIKARIGKRKTAEASLRRVRELLASTAEDVYPRPNYDQYAAATYFYLGEYQKASEIINTRVGAGASADTRWAECEMLSACPDPKYRNGARALKIATDLLDGERKSKRPERQQFRVYLLLANAQAECGDFISALASARRALELAGDCEVGELRARIKLFENKTPYRHRPQQDNADD